MANPNLANINYNYSKSLVIGVNTAPKLILQNLNDSNSVLKINSITGYNANPTGTGTIIVSYFDKSSDFLSNVVISSIPQNNTSILLPTTVGLIMNEGDYISTYSNIDNSIRLVVSYDEAYETANAALSGTASTGYLVDYLIVAGGGGGGRYGGGAGAGGLLCGGYRVYSGYNYCIAIGAGGVGGDNGPGHPQGYVGGNSCFGNTSFSLLCAVGGGGGGGGWGNNWPPGEPGGSGGGPTGGGLGGNAVPGQGYMGGSDVVRDRYSPWTEYCNVTCSMGGFSSSGGGGASKQGVGSFTGAGPSVGGTGCLIGTNGLMTYFAGGGGGNLGNGGPGGLGGGGPGNTAGGTNTGGGAGGQGPEQGGGPSGGSGIVMIAVCSCNPDLACIDAGLSYTIDRTTRPGFKVYRFTAGTGTVCW